MNTKSNSKKGDPGNSRELKQEIHPFQQEGNATDGGGFLDDGIRMEEQPFSGTEHEAEDFFGDYE